MYSLQKRLENPEAQADKQKVVGIFDLIGFAGAPVDNLVHIRGSKEEITT